MAIRTLRKFWNKAISNPAYALGALSLAGGLWKQFDPASFGKTMSFLDMAPTETPIYGQKPYTTGLPGSAPGWRREIIGYKSTSATDIFGKTKGLTYDIQKALGQSIATPFKFGALFAGGGEGYNYLFGKGTWGQFKDGLRGTLPSFLRSGKEGDAFDKFRTLWKAKREAERLRGSPGGGGDEGQGISVRRGQRVSGTYQMPNYQAGKYAAYNPSRLSANLLQTAYKDKYLSWIDRSARNVNRIGPNINFRTSIKVD